MSITFRSLELPVSYDTEPMIYRPKRIRQQSNQPKCCESLLLINENSIPLCYVIVYRTQLKAFHLTHCECHCFFPKKISVGKCKKKAASLRWPWNGQWLPPGGENIKWPWTGGITKGAASPVHVVVDAAPQFDQLLPKRPEILEHKATVPAALGEGGFLKSLAMRERPWEWSLTFKREIPCPWTLLSMCCYLFLHG